MKILVAGGAGFLGSHLCIKLISMGNEVICLDNLFTGKQNNIEEIANHTNFRFVEHNICDPLDMQVDRIYNLACPASPPHYQSDPVETVRTNVQGSIQLLELAKRYESRIFLSSTSEIYGDPEIHPQTENYRGSVNPIGPRACYDEGKRCAETLFSCYRREFDVDIKIARLFNTYGPMMALNDGRVVSNFIIQALQNKPITIYGKGLQTRSFCYVDDTIEGIIKFMDSPGDFFGPVNLGNPHEITVRELAEMILELTNSNSEIIFSDLPENDPKRRQPCIDLATKKLGWSPTVKLQDGLKATIEYFLTQI